MIKRVHSRNQHFDDGAGRETRAFRVRSRKGREREGIKMKAHALFNYVQKCPRFFIKMA